MLPVLYPIVTQYEPFHATPCPSPPEKGLFVDAVQLIPSGLVTISVVLEYPTATQIEPFQASPYTTSIAVVAEIQFTPSYESAITPPDPPASQYEPFHATILHVPPGNTEVEEDIAVQAIPSVEYASLFVPAPPATQMLPFHATELQEVNISFPLSEAFQLIPSLE